VDHSKPATRRMCACCGRPLSRYNDGDQCGGCAKAGAGNALGVRPGELAAGLAVKRSEVNAPPVAGIGPGESAVAVPIADGKTTLRQEKQNRREQMRADGKSDREMCAEFARVYRLRPRTAWRESHGWSLTEAARRINIYRSAQGMDPTGSSSMTGAHLCEYEKWPGFVGNSPPGRKPSLQLLAVMAGAYGCEVIELIDTEDRAHLSPADLMILDGLMPPVPQSQRVAPDSRSSGVRVESAGQPFRVPDLAEIDDMNRRELLRIITPTGALLTIGPVQGIDWDRLGYLAGPASKLDSQGLDEYAALISHLWRVFVLSRTKSAIFTLATEQLGVLTNSLERPAGPEVYRRLCGLASSAFQLVGEILFDGNKYTDAACCYALAATAGKEADMPDLWACALTRHAFIGVYERKFDKSLPMLELADALARRGDNALSTRYWVAAVKAEAFAGLGDLSACQRELDTAGRVHDLRGDFQNGGWLRFDGSRLAEERGTCYVQLGRPDLAESALNDALGLNLTVRRRGGVLTDLAMLGVQRRDPDQIIQYADAAVDMVRQTGSGVIAHKLSALRPHLALFLDNAGVRDLDGRISALSERS
jgi:transcriptional regulator with XRE-family HTH domain/tetratricopeptide (TPR) repeat protein